MPVYFFDFDGVADESEGIEFHTHIEAYNDARRAVTEMLEELTIDVDETRPLKCHCTIRTSDGILVGIICTSTSEDRVFLTTATALEDEGLGALPSTFAVV